MQAKVLKQPMIHFELEFKGIRYSFFETESNYCPFELIEQRVGVEDPDLALNDMFGFRGYSEGRDFFLERIGAENIGLLDGLSTPSTRFVIPTPHDYIERMRDGMSINCIKLVLSHAASQHGSGLLDSDDYAYLVEVAGKFLKKLAHA